MGNQNQSISSSSNLNSSTYSNSGTKTNKSSTPLQGTFKSNFKEIKMESTPLLGEYTVYEPSNHKFDQLVLVKETQGGSAPEFNAMKTLLQRRKNIKTDFLADFVDFFERTETEWCSKYYRLWVVYEYAPLTLEKELWDRFKMSQSDSRAKKVDPLQ